MGFKKICSNVTFDINEKKVVNVSDSAKRHVSGVDSGRCVAVAATMYAPNTSHDLCYGFFFPKLKDVELGGVYRNEDGSIFKIVSILGGMVATKVF